MRVLSNLVLVAIMVTSFACSGVAGSTPTAPSVPPTAPGQSLVTIRVVDQNSTPIVGATVDFSGVKKLTDQVGKVSFEVESGKEPDITIEAQNYHGPWETKLVSRATDYKMMKMVNLTNKIIDESIYGDDTYISNPGKRPALLLKKDVYIYIPLEVLIGIPELETVVRETVWLNQMLNGRISAKAGSNPGAEPVLFTVSIDENACGAGCVSRNFYENGEISGGTLKFKHRSYLDVDLVRHELLHILGLNHYIGEGLLGIPLDNNPTEIDKQLLTYIGFLKPKTVSVRNDRLALTLFPVSFSTRFIQEEVLVCNK